MILLVSFHFLHGNENSPLAASPLLGNFHFTMPAKPFVENWKLPFVTCGEIFNSCTRGFATCSGIIPSLQISMMGFAQPTFSVHKPSELGQFRRFVKTLQFIHTQRPLTTVLHSSKMYSVAWTRCFSRFHASPYLLHTQRFHSGSFKLRIFHKKVTVGVFDK